jgi:hypothetical protein
MAEFESFGSGVYFNLMALVKDSGERARENLAANIKSLLEIEKSLDGLQGDWRSLAERLGDEILKGPDEEMGLTSSHLTSAPLPEDLPTSNIEKLLLKRIEIAWEQKDLKEAIHVQNVKVANEDLKVRKDRMDLNPMVQQMLLDLEGNGVVQELLAKFKN